MYQGNDHWCDTIALWWQRHYTVLEYSPDSEGFWECRADGTLTIKRWSSTGTSDVSEGLKEGTQVCQHKYDLESWRNKGGHLCEQPSLNRGGGLRHQLSAACNTVLRSPPRHFNPHSHLASGDLDSSRDRGVGQCLTEVSHLLNSRAAVALNNIKMLHLIHANLKKWCT